MSQTVVRFNARMQSTLRFNESNTGVPNCCNSARLNVGTGGFIFMRLVNWLLRRLTILRWRESRSLTAGEWHVVTALLAGSDPRLQKMLLQWRLASGFSREFVSRDGSEIRIQWRKSRGSLSHVTLGDVASAPITVQDCISGRKLQFQLKIRSGGACFPLLGKALDAKPWPLDWAVDGRDVPTPEGGYMQLPATADQEIGIRRLEAWLEKPVNARMFDSFYEVLPGASQEDLVGLEQRIGIAIPPSYAELLSISNGLLVGETYILGTRLTRLIHLPPETNPTVIYLADDVINSLADGFYFLYPSGNNCGKVAKIDWSATISPVTDSLRDFIYERFEQLHTDYREFIEYRRAQSSRTQ